MAITVDAESGTMADGKGKAYLHEYFTITCILHGEITDLEEIKEYIIKMYVEKGFLEMFRPTYSQEPLSVVCESGYLFERIHSLRNMPGESYLTFILKGEPRYTEQVKEYIDKYVRKGLVALETTVYTKEKQYLVGQESDSERW